jgi:tetratricopeptide (TPR) repeat protein
MRIRTFLFTLTAAAIAVPAGAAVTVLGSSSARMCYLSAESRTRPAAADLYDCDIALGSEALSEADRVATHVNRGILKLRLRRLDAAIADFDEAIRRDPEEAEAYLNKGMAALHRDDAGWQEAVANFDTAIAKQTRRPELAYYGRAVANEMGGRIKAAYLDYKKANALAPEWREPKTELARFTVRQP